MSQVKTCHYCNNPATKLILWPNPQSVIREGKIVGPGRNPQETWPYCGCDVNLLLRRAFPTAALVREGVDYITKSLPENMHHKVRGDGISVHIELLQEDGTWVKAKIPKLAARKLGEDLQEASRHPEPSCKDADAHWHGHCGCK